MRQATRVCIIPLVVLLFAGVLGAYDASAQMIPEKEIVTIAEEELIVKGGNYVIRQITFTDYELNEDGTLGKVVARFDFLLKTEWEGNSIDLGEDLTFTMTGLNGDPDETTFEYFLIRAVDPDDKLIEETVHANHVVQTYTVTEEGEHRFQVKGTNGAFTGTEAYRTKLQIFNVGPAPTTEAPIAHDRTVETLSGQQICVDFQQTHYVTARTVPLVDLDVYLLITKPAQGSVTRVNGNPIPIYDSDDDFSEENTFDSILCYTPPSSFVGSVSIVWAVTDGEKISNHAVLTVRVNPIGTDIEEQELPSEVTLEQNYPNPFNPSTTVRFALPQSMNVRLAIYNLLGQEMMLIANEMFPAGSHEISVDISGSGWSSGVYVLRLESNMGVLSQKMVLQK